MSNPLSFGSLRGGPYTATENGEEIPHMKKIDAVHALYEIETGDIMGYGADIPALKALGRAIFDSPRDFVIASNPLYPRYRLDPHGRNKKPS